MKLVATIAHSVTNLFAKSAAPKLDEAAKAGLYQDQAVNELIRYISRVPDMDEVLRSAGIKRHNLRVLLTDDEIAQAVETRRDAILATPFKLEPSEGQPAEMLSAILKPILPGAVSSVFMARCFGYSVMEAVYEVRADLGPNIVGLKFLGEKPMEWFEPKSDGRLLYFPNNGQGGGVGIEVDQTFKFFLTRNMPTYAHPFGEALLTRLYWPWFFRNNGWKFWGKFLERFGSPLLVGKSTDPKAMVNALLAAHSNAVIGVGKDDSVEAVGAAQGATGQAFDSFESAVIRRIQKVILGQTLTSGTDGGSGNRALGQVHDTVRTDKRNADLRLAAQTMQRVVDAVCALNGWPKHEVSFADDVGLEADRATRDKDLYQVGVRFTPEYMQDKYDLSDVDFTMSSGEVLGADGLPVTPPQGSGAKAPKQPGAEPANPPQKRGQGAKASRRHIAFSKDGLTANQQVLEDQGAVSLDACGQPLPTEALRAAIMAAKDPQDLEDRLFTLLGDLVTDDQFAEVLERALFTADVLGYVHASAA